MYFIKKYIYNFYFIIILLFCSTKNYLFFNLFVATKLFSFLIRVELNFIHNM